MFCIAAFIVFVILGIFSAKYRKLAKKSWSCVVRKVTFRPCDVGFKEESKNLLIGKLILTRPRLAKFLDRWIEVFATIFVVLSIWSLLVVFQSGLNLLVYDTCSPKDIESCSLGGEACGISTGQQTFVEAAKNMNLISWTKDEVLFFGETVTRIPDRFKTWTSDEYLDQGATYYKSFDKQKQTALEIIDPGCIFCAKLFQNIKTAQFGDKYNLTYIAYAIPEQKATGGYKFPNSPFIISYLEAVKLHPLDNAISADWQLLEKIFLAKAPDGMLYQNKFNVLYSESEVKEVLNGWLQEIGYSDEQIAQIEQTAKTDKVKEKIKTQIETVEDKIRTIKIPTIIFDGRRYDRVIGPEKLK